MLPFTKRPARKEETSQSLDAPYSKQSVPPPSLGAPRSGERELVNDEDDMTSVMPSRSFTGPIVANRVLPAAGRPASVPPQSRRAPSLRPPPASVRPPPPSSVRPPPSSARNANQRDEDAEDDDDGRTVVRGAPKLVHRDKRAAHAIPASISPAAIIKTTLESARANSRNLLPGPPADLLEDSADRDDGRGAWSSRPHDLTDTSASSSRRGMSRGALFEGPPTHRPPPMSMEGPPSYPPPSPYAPVAPVSSQPGRLMENNGTQPLPYAPVPRPPASAPAAPPSVPAHFMTPQPPYSDPPGTAVTSGHRVAGRPAMSWAAALLACGLFVGVVAVAVMQSSDAVAETTASFVDPSRSAVKANAATAPAPAPTPVPVTPNGVPAPEPEPSAPPAPPAGLLGASPVTTAPPPVAPPAEPPAAAAPAPPPPAAAAAPAAPTAASTAAAAHAHTRAPAAATPTVVGGFSPVTVPATATPPKRPATTWKPAPPPPPKAVAKASPPDDDPPKKETKTSKKRAEPDDETRKALEALQKAQLESASSF